MVPAGLIDSTAQRVPLRISGAVGGEKAVAEPPVEAAGKVFRLGDIATITRGFEDPSDFLVRQKAVPALIVGVVMQKGGNILDLGDHLKTAVEGFANEIPAGIDIEQIADQPHVVAHAVGEFVSPSWRRWGSSFW